jgi:peptidoglycan/xylan/chitin deacetylase (PgdA/CDA1 family)
MLDVLESLNVTATFFIAGNYLGKGRMDDPTLPWPAIMQRMYAAGHQMASHSWTHQDLGLVNSTI